MGALLTAHRRSADADGHLRSPFGDYFTRQGGIEPPFLDVVPIPLSITDREGRYHILLLC